jgi:hypothetical protein
LDGAELACELERDPAGTGPCPATPPVFNGAADLQSIGQYIRCAGEALESKASHLVFARVPELVLDRLIKESAVGTFPQAGGDFGQAIADLRAAFIEIGSNAPLVADQLKGFAADVVGFKNQLQVLNLQGEVAEVQLEAQVPQQMANCASAAAGVAGSISFSSAIVGASAQAVVACANATAQIALRSRS